MVVILTNGFCISVLRSLENAMNRMSVRQHKRAERKVEVAQRISAVEPFHEQK
jgi:hypothetical protein